MTIKTILRYSLFLSPLILCCSAVSLAETTVAKNYAGGTGTEADPYQIANLAQLRKLSETTADWDKNFIQTADIDASDTRTWNVCDHDKKITTPEEAMGFSPIGDDYRLGVRSKNNFYASYNGMGYCITGLYINRPKEDNVGFLGYAGQVKVEIQNIALFPMLPLFIVRITKW